MTKTFQIQEVATLESKLYIDFKGNQLLIEHLIESISDLEDNSSFFLSFNSKETKKLIEYYKTDSIEDLIDSIHQHFTTYNSLKRYQDFLEKRDIYGTISSGCALID
ncbi:MAG: hypothetical protein RI983_1484 [Bacteroidota bacterium]|jgi:arsenate reductase-like glutaredoxin family protein